MSDQLTRSESPAVTPEPFLNRDAVARRQIVSTVGELVQKNPDKFRVVSYSSDDRKTELDVETILVYEDGDLSIRLNVEGGKGRLEQRLLVYDGSSHEREVIYRLDITREMGMQQEILQRARAGAVGVGERSQFFQAFLESWETSFEEANPPILVDSYAETKVLTQPLSELLQCYDEIKLPDLPLGNFFAPTLQEFVQAAKQSKGKGQDVEKLLLGE